jgi:tRNA pseudouridine38-40 synthase
MGRRNIKLVLAYDGTDFAGWQIQRTGRTVQGTLSEALERVHGGAVVVRAAGRTDAGVHATGQVANFFTELDSVPAEKYREAINSHLPADVRILDSEEVREGFHARRSARCRIYQYYLYHTAVGFPHFRRYCQRISEPGSLETLNRMASCIVGEHDFTTFAAAGDANRSKIRRIHVSCFYPRGSFLIYRIVADSFLWKMVRSLVGTMLDISSKDGGEHEMAAALEAGDRGFAGTTAPARGLFLEGVVYDGQLAVF